MIPEWLWATIIIPAAAGTGSWVWNVEKRLQKIENVKEKVDEVQVTVEKILFHLISDGKNLR